MNNRNSQENQQYYQQSPPLQNFQPQQPQGNQQYYQQLPQSQNFQSKQPKKKKLKAWHIVLIVIGAIFVLGTIANVGDDSTDKTSKSSSDSNTSSFSVTDSYSESDYLAVDYLTVYNNQSEYKDKKVKICGQISSINTNIAGDTFITFKEGLSGITSEVYCSIDKTEGKEAKSKYKEGDYVEIGGKVGIFVMKMLNIDECHILSSGDSVKKKIDDYKKQAEEESVAKEKEISAAIQKDKEDYIKECKTYTYKEIARNPSDFKNQKAKFEGKVIQIVENGKNVVLRVDITKEEDPFESGSYTYDDTIYVEYTRKSDSETRILEDDIINLYGTLNGTKSYGSVLSGNITIPYMLAEYIDIISD